MHGNHAVLLVLAAAMAAGSCGSQMLRPYESLRDTEAARRLADLIVEGEVADTLPVERIPVSNAPCDFAGESNIDCVMKTRVTVGVSRLIKGPPDVSGTVAFWFYSPCYEADPMVLTNATLPPILRRGDRLRVYLVKQAGHWWLIAHERWYRPPVPPPHGPRKPMGLPGPAYPDLPSQVMPPPPPAPPPPPMPQRPFDIVTPPPGAQSEPPTRWWPPPKRP
jgi:hypothetical protein